MFTTKEKIELVISGFWLLMCGVGAIWCYGRSKFYAGRVSAAHERAQLIND